jgi:hypothetical protein
LAESLFQLVLRHCNPLGGNPFAQITVLKIVRATQAMLGNTLPSTESGSVQSKFGKALPENVRIDVYNSPHGVGYQIYYEENGAAHSIGYGPEAADRTYAIEFPKPAPFATSTPAVQ